MEAEFNRSDRVSAELAESLWHRYDETGWDDVAFEQISGLISKTGLLLRQIGILFIEQMDGENEYMLGWEDFDADRNPMPIADDETITVVTPNGTEVARKTFSDFTDEELLKYGPKHFWIRETNRLYSTHCWDFSQVQFKAIEALREASDWTERAPAVQRVLMKKAGFSDYHPYLLGVCRLPEFDPRAVFLELKMALDPDAESLRSYDDWEWAVLNLAGERVAQKKFSEFTFEDFKLYVNDHLWVMLDEEALIDTSLRKTDRGIEISDLFGKELHRLNDEVDWESKARKLLPEVIKKTGLELRQVGVLVAEPRDDGDGYFLGWADFDASDYPYPLFDDEPILVMDAAGNQVGKKYFEEFTDKEILRFGPNHFWVRDIDNLDRNHCWSFRTEEFNELEGMQEISEWPARAARLEKSVLKKVNLEDYALEILAVQHVAEFDPDAVYIGFKSPDDPSAPPFRSLDNSRWRVLSEKGETVAEKEFREFGFAEMKQYFNDHFWLLLP